MTSTIDEAMRDFAVDKLNKEIGTDDETEIFTTIKIFGWDLFRVFRDVDKNIIKIILKRGNHFKEFTPNG